MLVTFVTTIKTLLRNKAIVLWGVAFPLVLCTLFYAMFSSLDKSYQLEPLAIVVVDDANYQSAPGLANLIAALEAGGAQDAAGTGATTSTSVGTPEAQATANSNASALFAPTFVANAAEALDALRAGNYKGYLEVNAAGEPLYHADARRLDGAGAPPAQSIIAGILDRYAQDTALINHIVQANPQLLAQPGFLESLTAEPQDGWTARAQITANPPSDSLRYYYAVLAFCSIMVSIFAMGAIEQLQANTSPLGARRSLSGQSKLRTLMPTLTASWLLAFACSLVGFLYLRLVFGVDFGGKEPAVVLTLAMSSLAMTFLGALIGTLPLPQGAHGGVVSFLSCTLSIFAGLYGPASQELGDFVARELPLLSACNPVRQVCDAFFSLYYYDSYERLAQCLVALAVFGLVLFIASTLVLRRQRYASL